MRIADYMANAGKRGEIFRGTLSVASGDDDFGLRIGSMDFADGVAGLRVCSSGDRAGVQDNEFGGIGVFGDCASLLAKLALDGSTIGLCGATAELFDVEGGHGKRNFK